MKRRKKKLDKDSKEAPKIKRKKNHKNSYKAFSPKKRQKGNQKTKKEILNETLTEKPPTEDTLEETSEDIIGKRMKGNSTLFQSMRKSTSIAANKTQEKIKDGVLLKKKRAQDAISKSHGMKIKRDPKTKEVTVQMHPKHRTIYSETIHKVRNTPIPKDTGELPDLLDFGVTYLEAKFIAEYIKDFDEIRAAREAGLTKAHMRNDREEEIINEVLNNPNVAMALRAAVNDQIQRSLLTGDRIKSQIAKMAFCDPVGFMEEDGSGRIKDLNEIPAALRCCISEITHTTTYNRQRGEGRRAIGHITKIKLHDSLKALKVLLEDITQKQTKDGTNVVFNQFNQFGPAKYNLQERIGQLSDDELDVMIKLIPDLGNTDSQETEMAKNFIQLSKSADNVHTYETETEE